MQECVTFSVVKAELMAIIACDQEIIHFKQSIESMESKVKSPMTIEVNNEGTKIW
jgi:hypothetical protein